MEYRARRRVFDQREEMNPQEFKESMDAVARCVSSYTFAWGGDAWASSLGQLPGQVKFFTLLAKDADRLTGENQRMNETAFIKLLSDAKISPMLAVAMASIRDASPNFLSPPVRGVDD